MKGGNERLGAMLEANVVPKDRGENYAKINNLNKLVEAVGIEPTSENH